MRTNYSYFRKWQPRILFKEVRHPKCQRAKLPKVTSIIGKTYIEEPFLFRYSDPKRVKWDLFVIALALYNCFVIPFDIAFIVKKIFLT
jgi:hypothetical protein